MFRKLSYFLQFMCHTVVAGLISVYLKIDSKKTRNRFFCKILGLDFETVIFHEGGPSHVHVLSKCNGGNFNSILIGIKSRTTPFGVDFNSKWS